LVAGKDEEETIDWQEHFKVIQNSIKDKISQLKQKFRLQQQPRNRSSALVQQRSSDQQPVANLEPSPSTTGHSWKSAK
jgi:hypothetical protein